MTKVLKYFDCIVILHNLLLNIGETELPGKWYSGWTVEDHAGGPDLVNWNPNDTSQHKDGRRKKLLDYLRDYVYGK